MLGDVGQRLLDDAEYGDRGVGIERDGLVGCAEPVGNIGIAGKTLQLALDGRYDAQIEFGGPQVGRNAVGCLECVVDHLVKIVRALDQPGGVGRQVLFQPGQNDLDGREVAAEVVVHLPGQIEPLLLLDLFDVRGQCAQLGPRTAALVFGQLALRDVQHDAVPDQVAAHLALADAYRHPFQVLPCLHPDATFPVETQVAAAGLGQLGQIVGLVLFQDQLEEALRSGAEGGRLDVEQLGGLLAGIAQNGGGVMLAHDLEGHAGDMRHDGAQIRFGMRQRLPRGLTLADVIGNADEHRLVVLARVEQPGFDRIAGAVAALEVHIEGRSALFAASQQAQQGVERAPVLGRHQILRRQSLQGLEPILQVACRGRVGLDDMQRVCVKDQNLGDGFLQNRQQQRAFAGAM